MRPITTTIAGFGLAGILAAPAALPTTTTDAPSNVAEAHTAAASVVINEFAPSGWSATDEFLELHNISGQWVSLGDWALSVCLSHDFPLQLAVFGPDDEIGPGQHLLVAHASSTGTAPDYIYDLDVPDDGGWLLIEPSGRSDGVALRSDTDCTEGDPAPKCNWVAGQAVARDQDGTDTDDNAVDFSCRTRTPGW